MFTVVFYLTVAHLSSNGIEAILRENHVKLYGAIRFNPADMARNLYAQGFITIDTLHMATSTQTTAPNSAKADILIEDSKTFILSHKSPAEEFAEFLGILENTGGASHNVAASILEVL